MIDPTAEDETIDLEEYIDMTEQNRGAHMVEFFYCGAEYRLRAADTRLLDNHLVVVNRDGSNIVYPLADISGTIATYPITEDE